MYIHTQVVAQWNRAHSDKSHPGAMWRKLGTWSQKKGLLVLHLPVCISGKSTSAYLTFFIGEKASGTYLAGGWEDETRQQMGRHFATGGTPPNIRYYPATGS